MKTNGRGIAWLGVVLALAGLVGVGIPALAADEKFPTRPINLIVNAGPGGGTDIVARIFAEALETSLGQKVVVLNKGGAAGTIGVNETAKARPDGYTLLIAPVSPFTMVPHVLQVPYTLKDFTYVTQITEAPLIYAVRSDFPAKTGKEFFDYLRKNPGKLTIGADGYGSIMHFAGARIFHAMGVKLRAVHFGGTGEIVKAFLGGHVDVCSGTVQALLSHVEAGKVRPLFSSIRDKVDIMPGMASVTELGIPEAETLSWRGIFGPKGIPEDRVAVLASAFKKAAEDTRVKGNPYLSPKTGEKLVHLEGKPFEEKVRAEQEAISKVIKQLDLGPK